jgi:RimJ/RimL family protein N-acetyltransferase
MIPKLITERLILREIKGNDIFGYYEILSDKDTMQLFGGPTQSNDIDNKDFVQRMRVERENGISYFWSITLKEEKEFIGFVILMSYNSGYYNESFKSAGVQKFDPEFLKYFDRANGWEIEYALKRNYRNKGIMKEAVFAVLEFCTNENISPIYAKVNSMTNSSTVSVLTFLNFKSYLPQINEHLLSKYDNQTILDNKEYGMIFLWST